MFTRINIVLLSMLVLSNIAGCAHHSIRVKAVDTPYNMFEITEEVRPWPITMTKTVTIKIPDGKFGYKQNDYVLQTNYPEKPVKVFKFSELEMIFRYHYVAELDGGWVAIYRDWVDIELLRNGHPFTFNGKYNVQIPFVYALP